jgi:hypothetical protein
MLRTTAASLAGRDRLWQPTRDGLLRHPRFIGTRDDKPAREERREPYALSRERSRSPMCVSGILSDRFVGFLISLHPPHCSYTMCRPNVA